MSRSDDRLTRLHTVDDFRRGARRRLPRMIFDFLDGGAGEELSVAANRDALRGVKLVTSAPMDVSIRSSEVTLFGKPAAMPVVIAPTGMASAFWPGGDIALAAAAARAGVPFVMSTNANSTPEDIAAPGGRRWFQLYLKRDRDWVERILDRVAACGFDAIEVTVDTAVASRRIRDARNEFSIPFRWAPAKLFDVLSSPAWLLRHGPQGTPKLPLADEGGHDTVPTRTLSERVAGHVDPSMTWRDIDWLRTRWAGTLIVKGLLNPSDARQAIAAGADGIVVSNHGGRQLDGAVTPVDVLPAIRDAVGRDTPILMDGGVRSGTDVLKALACGADAVQLGRATLYGLATAGSPGVTRVLDLIRTDLDVAQALCGLTDLMSGRIRESLRWTAVR